MNSLSSVQGLRERVTVVIKCGEQLDHISKWQLPKMKCCLWNSSPMAHISKHFYVLRLLVLFLLFSFLRLLLYISIIVFVLSPPFSLLLSENVSTIRSTNSVLSYVIIRLHYTDYDGGPDAAFTFVSMH